MFRLDSIRISLFPNLFAEYLFSIPLLLSTYPDFIQLAPEFPFAEPYDSFHYF